MLILPLVAHEDRRAGGQLAPDASNPLLEVANRREFGMYSVSEAGQPCDAPPLRVSAHVRAASPYRRRRRRSPTR